ncbi:MafI family immunity protein [Enhygromyxa salina]|uniref:MafI family immunity protein n=1 Tax=Enhygromyxa salina TaxID=215803 RepID=UPI0011BAC137|nr:MafI family immunity protein [Enhygromyxa salina]
MSNSHTNQDQILLLLEAVALNAPSFPLGNVKRYVEHGETVLALETLCDNLGELGVVLEPRLRAELVAVCTSSGVDKEYWRDFAETRL